MKGLTSIPSEKNLFTAYESLQNHAPSMNQLALWTQWVRFDPRLGEIFCKYLNQHWKEISPLDFNKELHLQPWPQAIGPIIEHTQLLLNRRERCFFSSWKRLVTANFSRNSTPELYFIGLRKFAGKAMREDAVLSHQAYSRWGYLGREVLVNKWKQVSNESEHGRTLLSADVRGQKLKELLKIRDSFTVNDYREFLGNAVSRRIAEMDLKKHPKIQSRGKTKGKIYFRVRNASLL